MLPGPVRELEVVRLRSSSACAACGIEAKLKKLETLVVEVPEEALEAAVEERKRDICGGRDAEARRERGVGGGIDGDRDEEQLR